MNMANKDEALEQSIRDLVAHADLDQQREWVESLIDSSRVDIWECASALLYLLQGGKPVPYKSLPEHRLRPTTARNVRYRLDVGSSHRATVDEIQAVLIAESGVERKRIGRLEIRENYTLVELPDGMPADIFQLLSEATVAGRQLNIKRLRPNRNKKPRHSRERHG